MEILIIGGILVALMVYISTKIKKEAKLAYEQEIVETEDFRIVKAEGFIIPVKAESEFEFEAYSKDFGEEKGEDLNQCWAIVRKKDGIEFDIEILKSERTEKDATIKLYSKTLIIQDLHKSLELEISVLSEYEDIYLERINLMLDSFTLK